MDADWSVTPSRAAEALVGASILCTALSAATAAGAVGEDDDVGAFGLLLFGVPLGCAAAALLVEGTVSSA